MKMIDLTHTFTNDMPVYPGDPRSTLEQVAFIEKDTYNDHKITTVMHVGTHMDAPLHMIANGKTMDEVNPDKFIRKGYLIDVRGKSTIDSTVLKNIRIEEGVIVLLFTGFGSKYKTDDYFKKYPLITEDFARKMVDSKIKMIGMDMVGPDHDQPWTSHKILLGSDIPILENLTNLEQLIDVKDFEVIALPMKLKSDAAPVRVIAKISD